MPGANRHFLPGHVWHLAHRCHERDFLFKFSRGSMQLAAGRTARDYNRRKARRGFFREHRYHVTAMETDAHLHCRLVHIDLNMVRAGAVRQSSDSDHAESGEIRTPPDP